jgi:hypothetical protein
MVEFGLLSDRVFVAVPLSDSTPSLCGFTSRK